MHLFGLRLWRAEEAVFQISDAEITNVSLSSRLIWLLWRSSVCSHAAATRLTDLLLPPVFSGSIYSAEDANKCIASYLTAPLWGSLNYCAKHETLGKIPASAGYSSPQEQEFCICWNYIFFINPTSSPDCFVILMKYEACPAKTQEADCLYLQPDDRHL